MFKVYTCRQLWLSTHRCDMPPLMTRQLSSHKTLIFSFPLQLSRKVLPAACVSKSASSAFGLPKHTMPSANCAITCDSASIFSATKTALHVVLQPTQEQGLPLTLLKRRSTQVHTNTGLHARRCLSSVLASSSQSG
jgi:hypothetical protein